MENKNNDEYIHPVRKLIDENDTALNAEPPRNNNRLLAVIAGVILLATGWYVGQSYFEHTQLDEGRKVLQNIQSNVASDAVKQYEIAAREGDRMQMYTQAGLCSACFLQAQDEINYRYWKHIEDSLAASLGMPTYR